jgi:hypothetical protein
MAGGCVTVAFLGGILSAGKSPNGECWGLGRSLLLEHLKGFSVLEVRSFLRWSSTIIVEA